MCFTILYSLCQSAHTFRTSLLLYILIIATKPTASGSHASHSFTEKPNYRVCPNCTYLRELRGQCSTQCNENAVASACGTFQGNLRDASNRVFALFTHVLPIYTVGSVTSDYLIRTLHNYYFTTNDHIVVWIAFSHRTIEFQVYSGSDCPYLEIWTLVVVAAAPATPQHHILFK